MEDARTRAARRHFDRWSQTYEHDRASRRLGEAQERALATLALRADDALLDVGCGTGAAVRTAAPLVARAVGFDLSPAMIARARELAEGLGNVELYEGDATRRLPFADQEFTAVLSTTAFHHFTDPERVLAEMARVLAPSGRLVIADANGDRLAVRLIDRALRVLQRSHVGIARPSALARDLRALGFASAGVATMWRGGYAIVSACRPAR